MNELQMDRQTYRVNTAYYLIQLKGYVVDKEKKNKNLLYILISKRISNFKCLDI